MRAAEAWLLVKSEFVAQGLLDLGKLVRPPFDP
jgi:hypothetical protein